MEDSKQKDYSFWGNNKFPSLYDAQVYERKFKSEYLERQFYERLLKSEPSIEKLIENKSNSSKHSKVRFFVCFCLKNDYSSTKNLSSSHKTKILYSRRVFLSPRNIHCLVNFQEFIFF